MEFLRTACSMRSLGFPSGGRRGRSWRTIAVDVGRRSGASTEADRSVSVGFLDNTVLWDETSAISYRMVAIVLRC